MRMNRIEFVKQNIFGKVLDLGCEGGREGNIFHNSIDNKNVYGMDLQIRQPNLRKIKGDALELGICMIQKVKFFKDFSKF